MRELEIFGAIAGVLSVWLLTKQNVLGWPIGIIYIVLAIVLFLQAHLYGELLAHVVFLVLSVYGWWNWFQSSNKRIDFEKTSLLSQSEKLRLGLILPLLSIATGAIFHKFTDNKVPYLDGLVMNLSFLAMWLSAKKKIENWHLWIMVNTLSIGIYLSQGLFVYMLLYCVFLAQAVNGLANWKKILRSAYVR